MYPLLAIIAVTPLVFATVALTTVSRRWRAAKAAQRARWETYTEIVGDGRARVGIALVARSGWVRHSSTRLRCEHVEEFPVDDVLAAVNAQVSAALRADAYNSAIRRPAPDTE